VCVKIYQQACKEQKLFSQPLQCKTVMHNAEHKELEPLGVAPNVAYMMAWQHCPKPDPHCVTLVRATPFSQLGISSFSLSEARSTLCYMCVDKQFPRAALSCVRPFHPRNRAYFAHSAFPSPSVALVTCTGVAPFQRACDRSTVADQHKPCWFNACMGLLGSSIYARGR
jgi:hypothetical protein